MDKLKKTNIVEESVKCSPLSTDNCGNSGPFFNPDYYAHVVVQTVGELESIPCKLRQDGLVATVVQDDYADYQLQSSRTGFGICDNNAWVKINSGDTFYDGGNLFIFPTQAEADNYKSTPTAKEGQVIYITETDTYFKYNGQDAYVDPFPNKLTVPTEDGVEGPDYKVPAYLEDGTPYWRSTKDFGKVKTVNGEGPDEDGNIDLNLEYIPLTGTEQGKDFSGVIQADNFQVINTALVEQETVSILDVGQGYVNTVTIGKVEDKYSQSSLSSAGNLLTVGVNYTNNPNEGPDPTTVNLGSSQVFSTAQVETIVLGSSENSILTQSERSFNLDVNSMYGRKNTLGVYNSYLDLTASITGDNDSYTSGRLYLEANQAILSAVSSDSNSKLSLNTSAGWYGSVITPSANNIFIMSAYDNHIELYNKDIISGDQGGLLVKNGSLKAYKGADYIEGTNFPFMAVEDDDVVTKKFLNVESDLQEDSINNTIVKTIESFISSIRPLPNDIYTLRTLLNNPTVTPLEYIDGTYVKKTISNYQVTYEPTTLVNASSTIRVTQEGLLTLSQEGVLFKVWYKHDPAKSIFIKSKVITLSDSYLPKNGETLCFEEILTGVVTEVLSSDSTPPAIITASFIGKYLVGSKEPKTVIKVTSSEGESTYNGIQNKEDSMYCINLSSSNLEKGRSYYVISSDESGNVAGPIIVTYN